MAKKNKKKSTSKKEEEIIEDYLNIEEPKDKTIQESTVTDEENETEDFSMYNEYDGNVGITTTSPSEKLDVTEEKNEEVEKPKKKTVNNLSSSELKMYKRTGIMPE